MRLTETQRQTIKSAVTKLVGKESRVWFFGSRVDDTLRGDDIDLLIETERAVPSRTSALCQLDGEPAMRRGDRKINVPLKDARTVDVPIFHAARQTGVLL